MGHRRLRLPRRGVEFLRRHLPQQRPQQRSAADHGERRLPRSDLRAHRRRSRGPFHGRSGGQTLTAEATGRSERFEIDAYKKRCLQNGYDDVDYLCSIATRSDGSKPPKIARDDASPRRNNGYHAARRRADVGRFVQRPRKALHRPAAAGGTARQPHRDRLGAGLAGRAGGRAAHRRVGRLQRLFGPHRGAGIHRRRHIPRLARRRRMPRCEPADKGSLKHCREQLRRTPKSTSATSALRSTRPSRGACG